jgi:alpha-D-ribose 1-methylphosphonate 5-triphosphate diphosphatase
MSRGVRQLLDDSHAATGILDEGAKREIRRATLTAVCVPGYQVPFGSREMPVARGWGRDTRRPVLERNMAWLSALATAVQIRLVGHDVDSPAAVEALRARGGAVAEFPTTLEAARTAHELGFPIVMGAPNVMRGESHSGNVSAAALVELGLVDALASDYLPSGLLAGAFTLARAGLATLPTAMGLVTWGAAAAAGLSDRGRLAAGLRADLALVDDTDSWPTVRATYRAA